ncbi:hypothetical protein [Aeromonas hydrophila]|uniref:hypothetical protein n=1 Tax=Aeromonas hydrophila TaxID=644 RepID=UPI0013786397|nr:hypothetical protein [Aeromonas hydrophila]
MDGHHQHDLHFMVASAAILVHVNFKTVSQISPDTNGYNQYKSNHSKYEDEGHESLQTFPVGLVETPDPYREWDQRQGEADTGRFQR